MDKFPAEQQRILRSMDQRIGRLEEVARTIPATPVTKSTGAFQLPDVTPSSPASGVSIYASSGGFRIKNSSGTVRGFPAASVSSHSMLSSTISSTPTAAQYNQLRQDVANLSQSFNNLLSSLQSAGLIA